MVSPFSRPKADLCVIVNPPVVSPFARPKAELCLNVDATVASPCVRPKAEPWTSVELGYEAKIEHIVSEDLLTAIRGRLTLSSGLQPS